MKVAVFYPTSIRNFNPFDSGERRIFEYLAKNYGLDITLFVDKTNNYSYTGNILKIREISSLPGLIQLPFRVLRKVTKYIPTPIYPKLFIKKELRNYDLVLTENPWYPLTLYPHFQARRYILVDSMILDQTVNKLTYHLIEKAAGIICITPLVVEKYKRLKLLSNSETDKVKVVGGHPIDTNLFKPPENPPNDEFINIVSTGRLVYEKGFHIIIEALKEVVKKHKNICLHIIGEGNYRSLLEQQIRKFELAHYVKFHGTLQSEQIAEIYKTSHIFVNHSLDTPYSQEAFGVANLEAMSAGLPVITTDCGAIPWVIKDSAIIVKQKDIKGLIEAIANLIAHKNTRIQFGEKGYMYVRNNYTTEKIAMHYYHAILELVYKGNN
jgi:glycosyltransferase involved in cell wall biosynthesis